MKIAFANKRNEGTFTLLPGFCLFLLVVLVLLVLQLWSHFSAPIKASKSGRCLQKLWLLEKEKNRWALENGVGPLGPVNEKQIAEKVSLSCPSGGQYFVNSVGLPVQCSEQGHVLSDQKSCRWNINTLNNAAQVWFLSQDQLQGSHFVLEEIVGYSKPIVKIPSCPSGGRYTFNSELRLFNCELGTHD